METSCSLNSNGYGSVEGDILASRVYTSVMLVFYSQCTVRSTVFIESNLIIQEDAGVEEALSQPPSRLQSKEHKTHPSA